MMLWRNGFEFRPDRIAGNHGTVAKIRLRARVGDSSKVDPFSQNAIGESGNRILFHDDSRIWRLATIVNPAFVTSMRQPSRRYCQTLFICPLSDWTSVPANRPEDAIISVILMKGVS